MKTVRYLLLLFLNLGTMLYSQTTYTLVTSGSWEVANNWNPVGIPGTQDFIIINDKTVNLNSSREVAGFSINDGNIYFEDSSLTFTINDSAVWYSGEIDGNGIESNNTVIIPEGALLILDTDPLSPETHRLYEGTTLINNGTVRHTGSSNLGIRGLGGVINNSLYDIRSDADFSGESFSGGYFMNKGIFRKSAGSGVSSINLWWVFTNDGGTIDIQSGIFDFQCNATFIDGNYNASTGATLSFSSHTQTIIGTLSGSPTGDILLTDAFFNTDSMDVTMDFKGKGFQWEAGHLRGTGTFIIPENALLVLKGSVENPVLTDETTILNFGTIQLEGERSLSANENSILDNRSLVEIISDGDFTGSSGGGDFINTGLLRKSGGDGVSTINSWWHFNNNNGTIEVLSGTLEFTGSGTYNSGTYIVSEDDTLIFNSGTQTFLGTHSGNIAGNLSLSDASIKIDSAGAVFNFQGNGIVWDAGTMSGGGTLTIPENALLTLNGTSESTSLSGTTIRNEGTIVLEGTRSLSANGGSFVYNEGLFDIITDADLTGGSGGGSFINTGIFRKSAGTDVSSINTWWNFFNEEGGVIEVLTGELDFTDLVSSEGSIIKGTGIIDVPGTFPNNGIVSPGASPGSLTYIGNYIPTSTAVLDIELGGYTAGDDYDQLSVTGNAVLDGSIKISLSGGFIPAKGDTFIVLTSTGSVTDSIMTITAPSGLYVSWRRNPNNVVVIIDSVGTIVSVEDNEQNNGIVTKYELKQNYPNPFNPETKIQFALPQASQVTVEIFNTLGERVDVIVSGELAEGIHNYTWNASGFSSGIYIYQISAGEFKNSKKMILLR